MGSVNDVDFHRIEPISRFALILIQDNYLLHAHSLFSVLSAGSDKQIYLGEFDG